MTLFFMSTLQGENTHAHAHLRDREEPTDSRKLKKCVNQLICIHFTWSILTWAKCKKKKKIHMRQLEKSENCIWWYYNIGCDNSSCFQMNSWLFWAANRNIYKWNDKIAGFPLKIIWCGWGIEKPERPQAGDCWSWEEGAGSCESRSCFLSP